MHLNAGAIRSLTRNVLLRRYRLRVYWRIARNGNASLAALPYGAMCWLKLLPEFAPRRLRWRRPQDLLANDVRPVATQDPIPAKTHPSTASASCRKTRPEPEAARRPAPSAAKRCGDLTRQAGRPPASILKDRAATPLRGVLEPEKSRWPFRLWVWFGAVQ